MSYRFSNKSKSELATVAEPLRIIAHHAIQVVDFSVLEGVRTKERQNWLYREGKSKVQWPDSKHNVTDPDGYSQAFDVAPYPIDWAELPTDQTAANLYDWARQYARFYFLAGVMKGIASELGYSLRWGGDWDNDNDFNDQTFFDLIHYELIT